MAHLSVLHWRIWAPLVYRNEDLEIDTSRSMQSDQDDPPETAQQAVLPDPPQASDDDINLQKQQQQQQQQQQEEERSRCEAPRSRNVSVSSSAAEVDAQQELEACDPTARA
jgi:hypothetical protein